MSDLQLIEEMDISESSNSSQENMNECQVLRLANPITADIFNNEVLDNKNFSDSSITITSGTTTTKATNFHPLMFSPSSPRSPDFPDLIPEKPKSKHNNYEMHFNPEAHSTALESESQEFLDRDLTNDYTEKLPDFPDSPTALKKLMLYDFPIEIPATEATSDNENDKSIYEAHLSPNFQNVSLTMNEKEGNLNFLAHNKQSNKLRKIKVMHTETSQDSDISSLDSISESLKSEDVFNSEKEKTNDKSENGDDETTTPEPIEPLSAAEERRHARYWQRMVLPGGEQRTIDMRVIEPYKRVLSHGGYMRAGGQTAIVIFSACSLPDKSRVDYDYVMDNLFLYILWTLERLVTEDYVLVYLHSGATRLPSFGWMKRCYQMVGRKLRKNLSHLYIVHPTFLIKTMLFMAKPFISAKFYRKISFIGSLRDLLIRVPLESAAIPEKVKAFDSLRNSTS